MSDDIEMLEKITEVALEAKKRGLVFDVAYQKSGATYSIVFRCWITSATPKPEPGGGAHQGGGEMMTPSDLDPNALEKAVQVFRHKYWEVCRDTPDAIACAIMAYFTAREPTDQDWAHARAVDLWEQLGFPVCETDPVLPVISVLAKALREAEKRGKSVKEKDKP